MGTLVLPVSRVNSCRGLGPEYPLSRAEALPGRSLPRGRYSGRRDAGCLYELTVKLLSEHEDVLAEFNSGQVAVPQDSDDGGWIEVSLEARGRRGGAWARRAGLVKNPPTARVGGAGPDWPRGLEEGRCAEKSRGLDEGQSAGVGWLGEASGLRA